MTSFWPGTTRHNNNHHRQPWQCVEFLALGESIRPSIHPSIHPVNPTKQPSTIIPLRYFSLLIQDDDDDDLKKKRPRIQLATPAWIRVESDRMTKTIPLPTPPPRLFLLHFPIFWEIIQDHPSRHFSQCRCILLDPSKRQRHREKWALFLTIHPGTFLTMSLHSTRS